MSDVIGEKPTVEEVSFCPHCGQALDLSEYKKIEVVKTKKKYNPRKAKPAVTKHSEKELSPSEAHKKYQSSRDLKFKCDGCDRAYESKAALEKHQYNTMHRRKMGAQPSCNYGMVQ